MKLPKLSLLIKKINAQLPNDFKDPKLFKLIKTYQIHAHSKYETECRFSYDDILLIRQLLQNHLILNLAMLESKRF